MIGPGWDHHQVHPQQPPSVAAARSLLDELVRLGLRHVVLAPGSRSAPLAYAAEALDRAGRLTLHVRIDERSAAFLALGLAKTTRVPAAVVTTSGTAVANLHPAVLEADHGQVPLILLTADRPPELRGVGANQATEQVGIFAPGRCRLAVDVETPTVERLESQVTALRTTAARAVSAATGLLGVAPGPVHLNLPYRDPLAPALGGATAGAGTETDDVATSGADSDDARVTLPSRPPVVSPSGSAAPTVVPHSEGTVVVVGDLPTAEHRRAVFAWAAHHCLPVLAEPGAPPAPEDAHVLVPHGTLALRCTSWLSEHRPERVVVVGRPTLGRVIPALVRESHEVHLVTDRAEWADPTHASANVHPFASLVLPGAPASAPTPWLDAWQQLGQRLEQTVTEHLATDGRTAGGVDAVRALEQALPADARIVLGSSSVARDHHLGLARPRADVDVVASRGLAGIDGCVATASGVALAEPRPTYAVVGDLTFLHDSGALVLGPAEPRPDLTVVVLDDRGGSIFTTLEYGEPGREEPFDRVFATPTATDLVALARAHGWAADQADGPGALERAVAEAPSGLRVVVVPLDLSQRRSQQQALAAAVSGL